MNPMIAALQKSRNDNPVSSSGPMPGSMEQKPSAGGDMEKYWQMIQEMNGKIDKLLSMFGGNAPENDVKENETNGKPGNGY